MKGAGPTALAAVVLQFALTLASKLGFKSFGDSYMYPTYRFFEAKMHGRYTFQGIIREGEY